MALTNEYRRALDAPIGLALAAAYVAILLATADPIGYCRDEGYYFRAGESYVGWYQHAWRNYAKGRRIIAARGGFGRSGPRGWRGAFRDLKTLAGDTFAKATVQRYWGYNWEHPALAKTLMGASWLLFTKELKWLNNASGFRLPGMIWAGLMVLFTYLLAVRICGRRAGLFAAFGLMLLPRFFFHAHLAAFDVPISALWLMVTYAFWRSLSSRWWAVLTGLFFGLALATKHNSWILPAPLGLYWLVVSWRSWKLKKEEDGGYTLRTPKLPGALGYSLILGPIVFIGTWPLLWSNTWSHIRRYVAFHMGHVHYDAYYFGTLHIKPPFPLTFPFGMTAITFPAVIVLLSAVGIWMATRREQLDLWAWHKLRGFFWWAVRWAPGFGAAVLALVLGMALLLVSPVLLPVLLLLLVLSWLPGAAGRRFANTLEMALGSLSDMRQDMRTLAAGRGPRPELSPKPEHYGSGDRALLLVLLSGLVSIVIIALPNTPIFGGTKHWMPAWPFLALLAGLAFERCWGALRGVLPEGLLRRWAAPVALAALLLLPGLIGLVRSHPVGLAYYNTIVGGPRGSATWKLQRQYWGFTMKPAVAWMNEHLKGGRRYDGHRMSTVWVHFHDTNGDSYNMYRRDGWMLPRIRATWWHGRNTRYFAFIHQKWLRTQHYRALAALGARAPVHGVYVDNAPLMTLWERIDREHQTRVRW